MEKSDFFTKVFLPYKEIQTSIADYKYGYDELLKSFTHLLVKLQLLKGIRDQAYHLKETIEDLDELDSGADLAYLSYIEPELETLIMELKRLESIFDTTRDFNKLIDMVEYSNRINLRDFI